MRRHRGARRAEADDPHAFSLFDAFTLAAVRHDAAGDEAGELPHEDARGTFAEVLRTTDSGQFSFFTTRPGITRGGHYHHTKSEKFLVVRGRARFGFRHVITGERPSLDVDGRTPQVVETVPGWVHDVTNIGEDEMIVLLWANEAFDPQHPDTVAAPVTPKLPQ